MKTILATVVLALALAAGASAARPTVVDEGGGGSSTPQVYIIQVYTPAPPWVMYCRYLDFGNGLVIQSSCWT